MGEAFLMGQSGGGSKSNKLLIFNQLDEPDVANGIWAKHVNPVDKIVVTRLNASTNGEWSTKASMLTARFDLGTAEVGGDIYAIGGNTTSASVTTNKNESYDLTTDVWSTKAVMPTARGRFGIGAVGHIIYVIAGYTGSGIVNKNEAHDTTTNVWTTKTAMPSARHYMRAIPVGDIIYAIGGIDSGAYTNKNEAYDTTTNLWTTKTAMPTARGQFAAAAIGDIIYAIAGYGTAYTNKNEAYDTTTNVWTTKTAMPSAVYAQGTSMGEFIYTFTSTLNAYVYNSSSDSWDTFPNPPGTQNKNQSSAISIGNSLHLLGGYPARASHDVYDLIQDEFDAKTLVVERGTIFDNRAKIMSDNQAEIDIEVANCYYYDGATLQFVPSATQIDGKGWQDVL